MIKIESKVIEEYKAILKGKVSNFITKATNFYNLCSGINKIKSKANNEINNNLIKLNEKLEELTKKDNFQQKGFIITKKTDAKAKSTKFALSTETSISK